MWNDLYGCHYLGKEMGRTMALKQDMILSFLASTTKFCTNLFSHLSVWPFAVSLTSLPQQLPWNLRQPRCFPSFSKPLSWSAYIPDESITFECWSKCVGQTPCCTQPNHQAEVAPFKHGRQTLIILRSCRWAAFWADIITNAFLQIRNYVRF